MRRTTLACLATVAAVSISPGAAPTPAAASYWTDCGTRQPSIFITTKAHAVSCKIAHRVGKRYALKGDRHPLGFRCSKPDQLSSGEAYKGRCKREGAEIKVNYGV
jgi:hypothetical protein